MTTQSSQTKNQVKPLRFADIPKPQVFGIIVANAGGTKLLQSYLDSHSQLYNIPAYPLLYFYPHWRDWEEELKECWNWAAIIDKFCEKHASVIDSRRIPGTNGLDTLGKDQNEHIAIDEDQFRHVLVDLLKDEPIQRSTFLLSVNYAYAVCKGEDLSKKKALLWHHHVYFLLEDFVSDFPDMILFGMIRDARPRVFRAFDALKKLDKIKLNETDHMIYCKNLFFHCNRFVFDQLHKLNSYLDPKRIYLIRHEDLKLKLEDIMQGICQILGINFQDSMLETTFDGKLWWGHAVYNMPKVIGTYNRVLSKDWQTTLPWIDIFNYEGIYIEFYKKYGYDLLYYKEDSWWDRIRLAFTILWPNAIEWKDLFFYLNPLTHLHFLKVAYRECTEQVERKDYTWNATYRHKDVYTEYRLWIKSWHTRWLDKWQQQKQQTSGLPAVLKSVGVYGVCMVWVYLRFLMSMLLLPVPYFRRVAIYYKCLGRRIMKKNDFPQLLKGRIK